MKIFILNPNFNDAKKSLINVRARQPLSLAIIVSLLQNEGHQIKFLDANVLNFTTLLTIKEIERYKPDILILTSTPVDRWECPNSHIDNVFKIINSTHVKYKILTGSHGTTQPNWVFKNCQIDFIVRGEPELIVKNLVETLVKINSPQKVKGVSWRWCNEIIHNLSAERITDLNKLPLPAYDLLPMDKYQESGFSNPFSIMMTSRGCPYNCTFCLKAMAMGKYVMQTPQRVAKEIEYLIRNFQIKSIYFQDWEFLIDTKRVEKICQIILEKNFKFKWGCNARASDIKNNQALIPLMKKAGCYRINFGLESASGKILNNINKKVTRQDLQSAVDILKSNQIEVGYYVLLNSPGENKKTIRETVDFIINNKLSVKNFNPVIPYPGTILFKSLKQKYPTKDLNWENIENFAGKIQTKMSFNQALLYLRHYKFQKQHGRFYFLKPAWWKFLVKKVI